MKNVFTIVSLTLLLVSCSSEPEETKVTEVTTVTIGNEIATITKVTKVTKVTKDDENAVHRKRIQERNGLYYEVNHEELFTGKSFTMYLNGQKETEWNYKDGKYDGLSTHWYKNGQKKKVIPYKSGIIDGLYTEWYENGKMKSEITYRNGNPVSKEPYGKKSEPSKQIEDNTRARRLSQAMSKYVPRIQQKVEGNWAYPPRGPRGCNPTIRVNLAPDGKVLSAKIVKSSGDPYCDSSVKMAFLKASPLPIPLDPDFYSELKTIDFPFRP